MKPFVTRRAIADGLHVLRRAAELIARIKSGDTSLTPPEQDHAKAATWLEWLEAHGTDIPFDLQIAPAARPLHARFLAACSHPPIRRISPLVRTRVASSVQIALALMTLQTSRRGPTLPVIDSLLGHPGTRAWDAACLFGIGWYAGVYTFARIDFGGLSFLWQVAGEHAYPHLSTDDVWSARRHVLSRL